MKTTRSTGADGMRRLLGLVVLIATAGAASARGAEADAPPVPPVWHPSVDAALAAAREDKGSVVVVFNAQWCAACHAFEERVLGSAEFTTRGGLLHVVSIDVDVAPALAQEYRVKSIPDVLVMSAARVIHARRQGLGSLAELRQLLDDASRNALRGEWLGTAAVRAPPRDKRGRPQIVPVNDLIDRLGSRSPEERAEARRALSERGARALAEIVAGSNAPYLGTRIGAVETLRTVFPGAPEIDPWAAPDERARHVAAFAEWREKQGRTEAPPEANSPAADEAAEPSADVELDRAVVSAVRSVMSREPLKRTEAMSTLLGIGPIALQQVRGAIDRCEELDDEGARTALQHVRWALVVPDGLEETYPGIRRSLALGAGPERRTRAKELRSAGAAGAPTLAELVRDPDSLVREAALHSLSAVRDPRALEAMASLLDARDSNLRMTAAQSLGNTKDQRAAAHVVAALDDADEVVVCAAIAALEEVKAADQSTRLIRCLKDPRWRVRAAAASALGALDVKDARTDLVALTSDDDGFVVKSALEALQKIKAGLSDEQLRAVLKRAPATIGVVLDMLIDGDSTQTLRAAESIYDEADGAGRAAVMQKLGGLSRNGNSSDEYWTSILEKAGASDDEAVRLACAHALRGRSPGLATAFVARFLDDQTEDVRVAGAEVVVDVVAHEWGIASPAGRDELRSAIVSMSSEDAALAMQEGMKDARASVLRDRAKRKKESDAEQAARTARIFAAWHSLLIARAGEAPDPRIALATYATGDARSDLPMMRAALADPRAVTAFDGSSARTAFGLLLTPLPWPEGEPLLETACGIDHIHALLIAAIDDDTSEATTYILDPQRVDRSLASASPEDQTTVLDALLQSPARSRVSLQVNSDRNARLITALAGSRTVVSRAAAAFARGFWDDEESLAAIERASEDPEPDVRRAALQSLIRRGRDRAELKDRMATLLSDTSPVVAAVAAVGLLLPEVRTAASLERAVANFACGEKVRVWVSYSVGHDERPLRPLDGDPAFLAEARRRIRSTEGTADDASLMTASLSLLLAQYGDSSGVERLVEEWSQGDMAEVPDTVIAGIALSGDDAYLDILWRAAQNVTTQGKLRELLKAVRGMTSVEAREFRREMNRRMRSAREY